MAGKIFVSYRRQDTAANALGVSQYLEKAFGRKNVFIDIDMRAGTRFPVMLEKHLAQCKVLLVLIGPEWLNSRDAQGDRRLDAPDDWVRLEIAQALKREITVIPICVGGANLPSRAELPEDIRGLVDHQAISITMPGFRHEMAGLARDIRTIPNGKSWRRMGLVTAGVAGVSLIALALFLFSVERTREIVPPPLPASVPATAPTTASQAPATASASTASATASATTAPATASATASNGVWSSQPEEWVLYGVDKQTLLSYYFKPSSLRVFGDTVAYTERFPHKPPSDQTSFQSAYEDNELIIDCKRSVFLPAERTFYNKTGEVLSHVKLADVKALDSGSGDSIPTGTIVATAENIFCNEKLRSPIAHDPATATVYNSPLTNGEGETYYSQPQKISGDIYNTLTAIKFYRDHLFSETFPGQEIVGLPHSFRTMTQPIQVNCAERKKLQTPKTEYFDTDNNLIELMAPLPVPTVDVNAGSPFEILITKTCNKNSNNVAGKYEGMNYTTYKAAGAKGDQRISIDIEQTGNQVKVSFRSANGGQGEGTGVLEGNTVKTIVLKSSAPNCPGSYEGSFNFVDDGSINWSFKGQDCSGPVEGHGTAKKAKV